MQNARHLLDMEHGLQKNRLCSLLYNMLGPRKLPQAQTDPTPGLQQTMHRAFNGDILSHVQQLSRSNYTDEARAPLMISSQLPKWPASCLLAVVSAGPSRRFPVRLGPGAAGRVSGSGRHTGPRLASRHPNGHTSTSQPCPAITGSSSTHCPAQEHSRVQEQDDARSRHVLSLDACTVCQVVSSSAAVHNSCGL